MIIHKCDRCGREIGEYELTGLNYYIRKAEQKAGQISDSPIDLCEDCYASFVDWMEGTEIYLENKTAFKPPKREPGEIKAYRLDEPNPDLICEMEGDLTMEGEDGQEE